MQHRADVCSRCTALLRCSPTTSDRCGLRTFLDFGGLQTTTLRYHQCFGVHRPPAHSVRQQLMPTRLLAVTESAESAASFAAVS
jgi:hypothetical protein